MRNAKRSRERANSDSSVAPPRILAFVGIGGRGFNERSDQADISQIELQVHGRGFENAGQIGERRVIYQVAEELKSKGALADVLVPVGVRAGRIPAVIGVDNLQAVGTDQGRKLLHQ